MEYVTRRYVDLACFVKAIEKEIESFSGSSNGLVSYDLKLKDTGIGWEFGNYIVVRAERYCTEESGFHIGYEKFSVRFELFLPDFGRNRMKIDTDEYAEILARVDNWDAIVAGHPEESECYCPPDNDFARYYFEPLLANVFDSKIVWRFLNGKWYVVDLSKIPDLGGDDDDVEKDR